MIISIINQKGGVAKTTSTFNIAHNLAKEGFKVLQVDIDPQASLTIANGIEPSELQKTMYDVMCENESITEIIYKILDNLSIAVSSLDLSVSEISLVNVMAREMVLKNIFKDIKGEFDYILIDCPPNLGLMTINALCAADSVIIPVATDYLSLRGVDLLVETIDKVHQNLNEKLDILGIISTMYDSRTRHANEILEVLNKNHNVLGVVSNSVIVKDSILASIPLIKYAPEHKVSMEYKLISDEIIKLTRK